MLGTSILNPKHFTTSSSLFASWMSRNTPQTNQHEFSRRYCAAISMFVSPLCRDYLARGLPCENRLAKLVNFANAAGRKREKRRWRLRGNLRTRALENSRCMQTRSFTGRSCYCFWNVSRALQLEARTEDRGDIARSYLGFLPSASCKDCTLIPESFVRSSRNTYRNTILILYANLHLFLSIFVTCISKGNN